jgi:hypothetical protein
MSEIITPEVRKQIIEATKQALVEAPKGVRNDPALKTTLLSAAVMARHLGYNRDELLFMFREEWRHMTAIDDTTIRK